LAIVPWVKTLGSLAGSDGGWRDDLPLSPELPGDIVIDATELGPAHPMFLVRLRVFLDWHIAAGRAVSLLPPTSSDAYRQLDAGGVLRGVPGFAIDSAGDEDRSLAVLPLTRLTDVRQIDPIADEVLQLLLYNLTDITRLGDATHMAVSELCANAIEHGAHAQGAYVMAERQVGRRRLTLAVADLGMGIPEHLRQQYPEWDDDAFAIGRSLRAGVSGTGRPDRGNGFPETLEAALTASLSAARLDIHSANGFLRTEITQEAVKMTPFPAARFRRGTWISYELVSV
jgi:hypothetical protein